MPAAKWHLFVTHPHKIVHNGPAEGCGPMTFDRKCQIDIGGNVI